MEPKSVAFVSLILASLAFSPGLTQAISAEQGNHVERPASPTPRPSGILGPTDQRQTIASDKWPWTSIGRVNVIFGPASRGF